MEPKIKILFVEDEEGHRLYGERYLQKEGFTVLAVKSAQEALETLKSMALNGNQFDIILTDYKMPRMNGATLSRRIKGDYGLPIVMLTGSPTDATKDPDLMVDAVFDKNPGITEERTRRPIIEKINQLITRAA